MRRYLLDTGPLAALLHGRPWAVSMIEPWIRRREAATSMLVYAEVIEYLKGLPNYPQHHAGLQALLGAVHPFALTYRILERYADVRRHLRRGGGLIGDIDTLIAATALERHLTMVTSDADFQRVPGLQVLLLQRREGVRDRGG